MSRATINPRVTIHRNGNATLSGIPATMLVSIINNASIRAHEQEAELRKREDGCKCSECLSHYPRLRWLLDRAHEALSRRPSFMTTESRWEDVRMRRQIRKMVDELFSERAAEEVPNAD